MKWLAPVILLLACLPIGSGCHDDGATSPKSEVATRVRDVSPPPQSADLDTDGDVDLADYAHFANAYTGPSLPGIATLQLSWMGAYTEGEPVCVQLDLSECGDLVSGGQFFLRYRRDILEVVGVAPGDWTRFSDAGGCPGDGTTAWGLEIRQVVGIDPNDSMYGIIDYMVGQCLGDGPDNSGRMLTAQFSVLNPALASIASVAFDPAHWWDQPGPPIGDVPPIRLTDNQGEPVMPLILLGTGPLPVGP